MNAILKTSIFTFIVAISGCANNSITSVNPNNLSDKEALIIVSGGAYETCKMTPISAHVQKANKLYTVSETIIHLNNPYIESHFDDEYGLVRTIVVKPGEYELKFFTQNPYLSLKDSIITKPFTMKPRQIRYIGEMHSNRCVGVTIKVNNRSERDLNYVRKLASNLNLENVDIDLVELIK